MWGGHGGLGLSPSCTGCLTRSLEFEDDARLLSESHGMLPDQATDASGACKPLRRSRRCPPPRRPLDRVQGAATPSLCQDLNKQQPAAGRSVVRMQVPRMRL